MMLFYVVTVAVFCYYLGYWVRVNQVRPPTHVCGCVSALMHMRGKPCPACGPDKVRSHV